MGMGTLRYYRAIPRKIMKKRVDDNRNRSKYKGSNNFHGRNIKSSGSTYSRNITVSDDEIEGDSAPQYRKRPPRNLNDSRNRKRSESDKEREWKWISEAVNDYSRQQKIKSNDVEKPQRQSHRCSYRDYSRNEITNNIEQDIDRNSDKNIGYHRDPIIIERSGVNMIERDRDMNIEIAQKDWKQTSIYGKSNTSSEKTIPNLKILMKNEKTSESNTISPVSILTSQHQTQLLSPEQPVCLVDGDMKFDSTSLDELLNDDSNYTVIGVLGMENVGKSTILSHFVIPLPFQHTTKDIFLDDSDNSVSIGLRAYITSDRMILIDTQPLFSPQILSQLENKPCQSMAYAKTQLDLQSLSIAVFIFAVCHIVLIVDNTNSTRVMRLIQNAARIRRKLSSLSFLDSLSKDISSSSKFPEVIFIYNKIPISYISSQAISRLRTVITRNLASITDIRMKGALFPSCVELDSDEDFNWRPNMYLVLRYNQINSDTENNNREKYESTDFEHFSVIMNNLTSQIRAMPKVLWGGQPTEREWLFYASRVWAEIEKSAIIQECSQELHKSFSNR